MLSSLLILMSVMVVVAGDASEPVGPRIDAVQNHKRHVWYVGLHILCTSYIAYYKLT